MLTLRSGEQLQALPFRRMFCPSTYIFEDRGHAGQAVNAGIDNQTQFVYQPFGKQRTVQYASALYRYAADAEVTSDCFKPFSQTGSLADYDV